ncbi:hypothetical protein C2G38_2028329 [Gigaspora rosea]|uniref:MD-2-related lipid-recognition domain-containing protein n=1 Tax=Gigaspora rosea TaxID=44941 RepID=A0A397W3P3_9GLOM|nr:hypothetical protein C2G38_2028329 [Gigaspora rosea]
MKNFAFVFFLFATLLTVNAASHQFDKRAATFTPCTDALPGPTVTMTPDLLVAGESANFIVSGTSKYDIRAGLADLRIQLSKLLSGQIAATPIVNPYYQLFNESFPANTPFSIVAPKVDIPSNLTYNYTIEVIIEDELTYGCSMNTFIN